MGEAPPHRQLPPIPANPGSNPLFKFEGKSVRVVMIEDKPWFVAVDVCRCIGRSWSGSTLNILDRDEKGSHLMSTIKGMQGTTIISESGLYKLIMRSDKPAAKRFQDWVTREVLPALRKDGGYIMALPTDTPEDIAIRALKASSEAIERLQKMVAERDAKISVLGVEKKDAVNRHKAA